MITDLINSKNWNCNCESVFIFRGNGMRYCGGGTEEVLVLCACRDAEASIAIGGCDAEAMISMLGCRSYGINSHRLVRQTA